MSLVTQKIKYRSADGLTDYTINDQASMRSNWAISPHYYIKLDTTDGIYGADITSESHPIPHDTGDKSWSSFRKGKGLTLSGSIFGRTIADKAAAALYLQEAFYDMSLRKLIWVVSGTSVYLKCRVLNDLVVTENYSDYDAVWQWTVGLRADDPRYRKLSDDSLLYAWMV